MFWSLQETNRLRIARRIVGGVCLFYGCVLVTMQSSAFLFNTFDTPSRLELAKGIGLTISGFGMLLNRSRTKGA